MKILAGGFGKKGLLVIPFLKALEIMNVEYEKLVVNGIGGYYATVRFVLGEKEALARTEELLRRIERELYMVEREWICEGERKKGWKKTSVEHCVRLALEESMLTWSDVGDLLNGLDGREAKAVAEVVSLRSGEVKLVEGDALNVAKASLTMVGIFPPLEGFVSTTHYTQIPVKSSEDGDLILVNFRDTTRCAVEKADELLSQAAEIRSIYFAKMLLEKKSLLRFEVNESVKNVSEAVDLADEYAKRLERVIV